MDNNHGLLPDLRVFASVVEHSSFTVAARELGTSTAAISRAIQRLEEALGGPLLHRTTRRVGLTERGARLHARTHTQLRDLQCALDDVKHGSQEARGLLRVTCAQTIGRHVIAPAVFDFRILHPDIQVELALSDEIVDLVTSGCHVAIRGGRPRTGRYIARPLAPTPLYTCASPALLRRHRPPQHAEDFRTLPCIGYRFRSTGEKLAWEFVEDGRHITVDVAPGLWVDDNEVAKQAALAGLGFAQLPGYLVVEDIRAGRLVTVLPHTVTATRAFSVVYLNRTEQQPLRERLFIEHLLAIAADKRRFQLTPEELAGQAAPAFRPSLPAPAGPPSR